MIKTFIERPVLSSVISVFIVLLGVLSIKVLPVTEYPDIAPPTISIWADYTGADSETVQRSTVVPIEEEVNGVEGMTYIKSTSYNSGNTQITVYFKLGQDPDIATVNVQNRVARAAPILPTEVTRNGVVTEKQQTSALMFLSYYSTNPAYDDLFIQNYLNINIIPEIKRIYGVGNAETYGLKDYSMRIWLDPQKLANFNLVPIDVVAAINEQSQQAAPGQLGQNIGEAFQFVIKYSGKFEDVEQYQNIILKGDHQGQILRLKDVAEIELSSFSDTILGETNGYPSMTMAIYQTPGSNAKVIIEQIEDLLEESKKSYPEGLEVLINYNTDEFLSAAMENVVHTLFEAFILVFIVVFIFLQDLRSTLIPAIAVPVSIIGTFFFLNIFGYSINLLTLFAMILAIGIVVDDAIVVVEAVHADMEKEKGRDIKDITISAMSHITGAIISITLVMAAVFVPVTFVSGTTGVFYQQFGITLMIAIIISAVNALTLSPMLCALFLKPHHDEQGHKKNLLHRFYDAFNAGFTGLTNKYTQIVGFLIRNKIVPLLMLVVSVMLIVWVSKIMPTGFVPNEDRKVIFSDVQLPPGTSLDRTFEVMRQLNDKVTEIPGVTDFSFVSGVSLVSGAGNNYGVAFVQLENWEERGDDEGKSIEAITKTLFALAPQFPDAQLLFFNPPSIPGFGVTSGFEMQVLDKSGGTAAELDQVTKKFLTELTARPEILYAQTGFNTNYPQYEMLVDSTAAKEKGVNLNQIFTAMSGYIGAIYATNFTKFGKQFRVMVQALPEDRRNLQSLNKISVRNNSGQMIPITQFIEMKKVSGPQSVNRFNLFSSAAITGGPTPGFSSGDAINAIEETAQSTLPANYDIDFSGLTREEISSAGQTTVIFLITILFVYLLLSAQYESYILPFAILFCLPLGIMGAFISQKLAGLENNIFFQIALIMLVGLLAKNAILIVEFARQERYKGLSITEAAIRGAKERLRPILMTSFAFILGLMPMVLSSGVGAIGNRSLATGAAFGLLIGTALGVLVIPTLFVIFQTIQEKVKPLAELDHKEIAYD